MHFPLRFQILKEQISDKITFYPEEGSVRKFLRDYTASQPKRRLSVIITAMLTSELCSVMYKDRHLYGK